jgi:hypothetical protein
MSSDLHESTHAGKARLVKHPHRQEQPANREVKMKRPLDRVAN